MSIIVEDGTGKATAETFISVADTDTYHTARGNLPWLTITDAQKEQALRRATEYMTATYRNRWQGQRTTATVQALCWPRVGVTIEYVYVDCAIIPETIKQACAEMALRAAAGPLLDDLTRGVISEQVGSIAVTYDKGSPQHTRYAAIDAMLAPYLKAGSNSISMGLVRS